MEHTALVVPFVFAVRMSAKSQSNVGELCDQIRV
jgi:hypothetical protein